MTVDHVLLHALWMAVVFEALTIVARFGLKWESQHKTRHTVGRLFRGIRIHHGYLVMPCSILAAIVWPFASTFAGWVMAFGLAMLWSDLVHHFVVLHRWAGHHEWHWTYPDIPPFIEHVDPETREPIDEDEHDENKPDPEPVTSHADLAQRERTPS